MSIANANRIVDFLISRFFYKNGFAQEESQHILISILIQDGE